MNFTNGILLGTRDIKQYWKNNFFCLKLNVSTSQLVGIKPFLKQSQQINSLELYHMSLISKLKSQK